MIIQYYSLENLFSSFESNYNDYGILIVLGAGFTPFPFKFINETGYTSILEGDSLKIAYNIEDGFAPDSINIFTESEGKISSYKVHEKGGAFSYDILNILHDFSYWAEYESRNFFNPWDKVISKKNNILVLIFQVKKF